MWNQLCKIIEKNPGLSEHPFIREVVPQARLFMFDKPSHTFLYENGNVKIKENFDEFRLPFDVVAVQDPASLIVIADVKSGQKGYAVQRDLCELINLSADSAAFDTKIMSLENVEHLQYLKKQFPNAIVTMLAIGSMEKVSHVGDEDYNFHVKLQAYAGFIDGNITSFKTGAQMAKDGYPMQDLCRNWPIALQELEFALAPKNFILETTPKRVRELGKKIPRQHERPVYTILEPNKIRKIMGLSQLGNGSSKMPHERRGHYRTLQHEKYGDNRGRVSWIKPTWIGPAEACINNKQYRVRLDL